MLNDAKDLQAVYIVCGYTDLRKGIDSLSNIISQMFVISQNVHDMILLESKD